VGGAALYIPQLGGLFPKMPLISVTGGIKKTAADAAGGQKRVAWGGLTR
jgi:hypothetical protein